MSLIQKYNEEKQRHAQAKRYFDVFDQPGHMNQCGKLVKLELKTFTVYHQAYVGANNYHDADEWLKDEIAAALTVGFGEAIRRSVMARLEARMVAAAKAAQDEAKAVLAATEASA